MSINSISNLPKKSGNISDYIVNIPYYSIRCTNNNFHSFDPNQISVSISSGEIIPKGKYIIISHRSASNKNATEDIKFGPSHIKISGTATYKPDISYIKEIYTSSDVFYRSGSGHFAFTINVSEIILESDMTYREAANLKLMTSESTFLQNQTYQSFDTFCFIDNTNNIINTEHIYYTNNANWEYKSPGTDYKINDSSFKIEKGNYLAFIGYSGGTTTNNIGNATTVPDILNLFVKGSSATGLPPFQQSEDNNCIILNHNLVHGNAAYYVYNSTYGGVAGASMIYQIFNKYDNIDLSARIGTTSDLGKSHVEGLQIALLKMNI